MALLRAGYAAGRKWESALRTAVGADRPWRSRGDRSGARGCGVGFLEAGRTGHAEPGAGAEIFPGCESARCRLGALAGGIL